MAPALGTAFRFALGRVAVPLQYLPPGTGLGQTLAGTFRQVMLTGAGVTAPFLVTFMVLGFVVNFLSGVLEPFVVIVDYLGIAGGASLAEKQILVVLFISASVFVIGLVTETSPGNRVGGHVQTAVESIPGVGSVYTSFDRMSEVLLDDDADSFQEVKLVEFPQPDTYAIAFVTASGPESVSAATGEGEMQVLFVPMAPNPVMGGHMVFVPTDRIIDVDMTVQEAFQAIVTSGVAAGDRSSDVAPAEVPGDIAAGEVPEELATAEVTGDVTAGDAAPESL